jgi:hypothetical protein
VTGRTSTRLAAWNAVALGALAGGVLLFALNREVRSDSIFSVLDLAEQLAPAVAFFVTGLVIRTRRPGNLVGGLCFAIGLIGLIAWLLTEYAGYGLVTHPGSLPGARAIEVALQGSWALELALLLVLVCVFPDGRLLPGRWRLVPSAGAVAFGALWLLGMTTAPSAPFQHVHDPLHVTGHSPLLLPLVIAIPLAIASVIGAVATVVVRFRRAHGDEREQLKWLILAASVLPVGLVAHTLADTFAPGADKTIEVIFSFAVVAFPVAIGIAVLKYRLYEIDRIISRTLVYGVLSALLAGAYFAIVLALQASFGSLTHGNELAVACSTLAVAALFRPLRRRLQTLVDRRFYRNKVNAEATLAQFAARLRHEADLDVLLVELRAVVGQTMAPEHVSLWLRSGASPARNDPETVAQ